MKGEMTLRTWIKRFKNGDFDSKDVTTETEAGRYDLFCKDSSLANKVKRIGKIIKLYKDWGKITLD